MVRSAPTCVEAKDRHPNPPHPIFGTLEGFCSCGCGGKTFRWAEGAPLAVCFRTMAGVRELILRAPLATTQKHLLHVFLHHTRDQRECWPSEQRLLLGTGVRSRQTLSTHKKVLKELGILDWLRPGHPGNPRSCALYHLSWEALQILVEAQVREPAPRDRPWSAPSSASQEQAEEYPSGVDANAVFTEQEPQMVSPAVKSEDLELVLDDVFSWLPGVSVQLPDAEDIAPVAFVTECAAPVSAEPPSVMAPPREPGLRTVPAGASTMQQPPAPSSPCSQEQNAPWAVPIAIVWNLWREAYQRVYGRPYLQTAADRPAAREIAEACTTAVLHHEQGASLPPEQREQQAQTYLRHVFNAFLQRAGRRDFLRERGHPLGLLMADLNALGTPWGKGPPARPLAVAPPPTFLAPQENAQRIRKLLQGLKPGQTATPRPGVIRRKD